MAILFVGRAESADFSLQDGDRVEELVVLGDQVLEFIFDAIVDVGAILFLAKDSDFVFRGLFAVARAPVMATGMGAIGGRALGQGCCTIDGLFGDDVQPSGGLELNAWKGGLANGLFLKSFFGSAVSGEDGAEREGAATF